MDPFSTLGMFCCMLLFTQTYLLSPVAAVMERKKEGKKERKKKRKKERKEERKKERKLPQCQYRKNNYN